MNLSNFFYKQNLLLKAASSYKKVLAIDSRNAEAYNNLAVINYRLEKYKEALEYLKKAESMGFQAHPDFKTALLKKIKKIAKPYSNFLLDRVPYSYLSAETGSARDAFIV